MKAKNNIYTVVGATGNIGRTLVRDLIKKGNTVRAVGRDAKKLAELKKAGAEVYATAFDNVGELTKVFTGADAVVTLLPPAYSEKDIAAYQDRVSEAFASAIVKSGVKNVVNISSVGAQSETGTGIIEPHYKNEQRLNKIKGINVVHLRPPMFMENFYWATQEIEGQGTISQSLRKDLPISFIATADVAKKAGELLETLNFKNATVVELYGPETLTLEQVTTILAKAAQRVVRYNPITYEEEEKRMVGFGVNPNSARLLVALNRAVNENKITATQKQTPQNTGTTTLSAFAKQVFSKNKAA